MAFTVSNQQTLIASTSIVYSNTNAHYSIEVEWRQGNLIPHASSRATGKCQRVSIHKFHTPAENRTLSLEQAKRMLEQCKVCINPMDAGIAVYFTGRLPGAGKGSSSKDPMGKESPQEAPPSEEVINLLNAFTSCALEEILPADDSYRFPSLTPLFLHLNEAANKARRSGLHAKEELFYLLFRACYTKLDDLDKEVFSTDEIHLFLLLSKELEKTLPCHDYLPLLKARLSDIAWIHKKPRDRKNALQAIESYTSLALETWNWSSGNRDYWNRAVQICKNLGKGASNQLEQIERVILEKLKATTLEDRYYAKTLAQILLDNDLAKALQEEIAQKLFELAQAFEIAKDYPVTRDYYSAAAEWYKRRCKDEAKYSEMIMHKAECFAQQAESHLLPGQVSHLHAMAFFESAIKTYREIENKYRPTHRVEERLDELHISMKQSQQRSRREMKQFTFTCVFPQHMTKDAEDAVRFRAAQEALSSLAKLQPLQAIQKLKEEAEKWVSSDCWHKIFPFVHLSKDGRKVASSEGSEEQATWDHLILQYRGEIAIAVSSQIIPALEIIRRDHQLNETDFIQLAQDSPTVPPGRENLIGKALFAGYRDDFTQALHLLAPQIEHIVRYHLNQRGITTSKLSRNNLPQESGLSALLNHDQVKEIFGDEVTLELKALFCEARGPNLRNSIAHGLLSTTESCSLNAIYAWWFLLKMVLDPSSSLLDHRKAIFIDPPSALPSASLLTHRENTQRAIMGKSLEEAFQTLCQYYPGLPLEKRQSQAEENYGSPLSDGYPLDHYFNELQIQDPPKMKRPKIDGNSIWKEMVDLFGKELDVVAYNYIGPALETIRREHRVTEAHLIRFANLSLVIPPGREVLFAKALFAGFEGDFVTALHLLVPQIENLVRYHLNQNGSLTSNIDPEGIENENALGTLMEQEKTQNIFGKDVSFELKALFCDPLGPNLRNATAHGLLDQVACASARAIYAWWLGMRLVFDSHLQQRFED